MDHPGKINIEKYSYELPPGRIAEFPLHDRDQSKLLVYKEGRVTEQVFSELPGLLPENSILMVNETKVIQARLLFRKNTGSLIEIFCLEPVHPSRDFQLAFATKGECTWNCLVGNSKRWKSGILSLTSGNEKDPREISAERVSRNETTSTIRFRWNPSELTFSEILDGFGIIPLPPYIKREATDSDRKTYQTVYALNEGSVAAPTAGLHFTENVLDNLRKKNITRLAFTLHVGAGTFRPVNSAELTGHAMHSEKVRIPKIALFELYKNVAKPKIVVGTTTTRLVESIYWQGVKWSSSSPSYPELDISQWEPYEKLSGQRVPLKDSLKIVLNELEKRNLDHLSGETSLIIAPGYEYQVPDIMITNFHQPRSTLLLLIAAFIGEDWRKAYRFALDNDFRFLSYGDSCLFFKKS
jgi:S-adenosylmethionine:tRNA ribosyltransferase-isomerase